MARHFDDLGNNFDQRWKRSTRTVKRELIAELRELYLFLDENDDTPLLAGAAARRRPGTSEEARAEAAQTVTAASTTPTLSPQGHLFSEAAGRRPSNPFISQDALSRLQKSQEQATRCLRELMQQKEQELNGKRFPHSVSNVREKIPTATESPLATTDVLPEPSASQMAAQATQERELRQKLSPMVEDLLDARMDNLKAELRTALHEELDRLIAEHMRKANS